MYIYRRNQPGEAGVEGGGCLAHRASGGMNTSTSIVVVLYSRVLVR